MGAFFPNVLVKNCGHFFINAVNSQIFQTSDKAFFKRSHPDLKLTIYFKIESRETVGG